MSGLRPWQLSIWQSTVGAPFVSLGVHVDLHTPTIDFHLPGFTVQFGCNGFWGVRTPPLDGGRSWLGGRVLYQPWVGRWDGHTDNCDHAR